MDKIAIYTCIIGGYDKLLQPAAVREGFDFICFVGKGEKTRDRDGVWEIRELPYEGKNRTLTARYPKLHPHELLPEYEYSLWIDGNISIESEAIYDIIARKIAGGVEFSGMQHPSRDCIYAEAEKCRDMRYISYLKLAQLHTIYLFSGVKRHSGLMEANVIFRKHNAENVLLFDKMWWDRIEHLCLRDQLSQMLVLHKCGLKPDYLLPEGQSTRNHPGFKYRPHKK